MKICRICRYRYDITKNVDAKLTGGAIQNSVSAIFDKFEKGEQLDASDLDGVTIENVYDDERYDKLKKPAKQKLKTWLRTFDKKFVQEGQEEEAGGQAYYICKNCNNSEKVPAREVIYSKSYASDLNDDGVSDLEIYDQTLTRTRTYICVNESCPTHKGTLREATLTKDISGRLIYLCVVCNKKWSEAM